MNETELNWGPTTRVPSGRLTKSSPALRKFWSVFWDPLLKHHGGAELLSHRLMASEPDSFRDQRPEPPNFVIKVVNDYDVEIHIQNIPRWHVFTEQIYCSTTLWFLEWLYDFAHFWTSCGRSVGQYCSTSNCLFFWCCRKTIRITHQVAVCADQLNSTFLRPPICWGRSVAIVVPKWTSTPDKKLKTPMCGDFAEDGRNPRAMRLWQRFACLWHQICKSMFDKLSISRSAVRVHICCRVSICQSWPTNLATSE